MLVLARLQLRSRASNEVLQEADVGSVFEFTDDDLVRRWRMYADPVEALRAVGISS